MPTVPIDPRSRPGPTGPQPTPAQLLMALATMKDLGRLAPKAMGNYAPAREVEPDGE